MKRQTLYLAIIIEVAFILRVWGIDHTMFWYDEAFTFLAARLALPQLIVAATGDVHPPLYYILIKPFALLPWQPGGLRLPSALCSAAGVWLVWLISGRYNLGPRVRLLAAGIMAIWPAQLYYAQEARMYALLQLLVLGCWLATLDRRWKLSAALGLLAMYTHLYGIFYIFIIGLCAFSSEMMRPRTWFSGSERPPERDEAQAEYVLTWFGLAFLLWLPWAAVIFLVQLPAVSSGIGYWLDYMTPGSLLLAASNIFFTTQGTDLTDPFNLILLSVAIPVLTAHAWRHKRLTMLLLGLGPAVIALTITFLWRPMFLGRGLFPSTPALYILLAEWFSSSPKPRKLFALALVAPALIGAYAVWFSTMNTGERTMSVNYANAVQLENLPVLHLDDSSVVIWKAARPDLHHYLLKNPCAEEPGSLTERTRAGLGFEYVTPDALPEQYYIISVANIFSDQCMIDRNRAFTAGARREFSADLLYGDIGVYLHGSLSN